MFSGNESKPSSVFVSIKPDVYIVGVCMIKDPRLFVFCLLGISMIMKKKKERLLDSINNNIFLLPLIMSIMRCEV